MVNALYNAQVVGIEEVRLWIKWMPVEPDEEGRLEKKPKSSLKVYVNRGDAIMPFGI